MNKYTKIAFGISAASLVAVTYFDKQARTKTGEAQGQQLTYKKTSVNILSLSFIAGVVLLIAKK